MAAPLAPLSFAIDVHAQGFARRVRGIAKGGAMANIRDIAEKCKVNIATVSRAINGKKGVSEKLRAKIVDTAREMGY